MSSASNRNSAGTKRSAGANRKSNNVGAAPGSKPEKPVYTIGAFSEIADKRKVFVNIRGDYGDKITARLRADGGFEIVRTAREADFTVWFYDWAREERIPRLPYPYQPGVLPLPDTIKNVTGGTLIITIRDPSQHVPRIIWQKEDTDGGVFRKGDACEKLVRRFISDLKKLRGEK
jgi:hypothetical protein